MIAPAGLLDSNVIVACLAQEHEQHAASLAMMNECDAGTFAIAAHSFAEAYATLTRNIPFRFTAEDALTGLESVRAVTSLVGLTPPQAFDTIGRYAAAGGTGPRLYDALIGQVAVVHGIPAIVTWNTRHMGGLFPNLTVVTPVRYLAMGSRRPRS